VSSYGDIDRWQAVADRLEADPWSPPVARSG